ncbi:MAG: tetratricopeptide repeat protein, partial [Myxococcota bacterium]|nr:tetratricopeptide repeat protein [Myxococcota bacterium]
GRDVRQGELRALTRYRNEHPQDARARLLLGHAYMQRGWFSHAIEQYERAMALDLGARGNPELLENLLRAARTETLAEAAGEMVSRIYGAEASSELQRAIARTHDAGERARLEALAARLGPA